MSRLRSLAAAVAVIVLPCLLAACAKTPPPAMPELKVDGDRAMTRVEAFLALGPRVAGSAESAQAAQWLAERCRKTGAETRIDEWTEPTPTGPKTFRNVIATLPGSEKHARILVGSHFDSKRLADVPDFGGANDSGSSTGLLLELLSLLAASRPWAGPTLEFAFFDGEECQVNFGPGDGLHGSRRLASQIDQAGRTKEYRAMILLDMIGDRDLGFTLPKDTDQDLLRRTLALATSQGVARQVDVAATGMLDDHVPFQELGIPAIDFIDFQYGPGNRYWHTAEDTLDKLSPGSLALTGNLTLALLRDLAQNR